jgi:chromate reductase, NAD(P)H dehydrogenase (quinone)
MRLLAISGSLRAGASNTAILQAAARVAPQWVAVRLFDGIGSLPHFNPDLDSSDGASIPEAVAKFRRSIGQADGLLISTPEYAHGLPGAFKNALDWLVGSVEFPGKLVALIFPSSRSTYAQAQLREVLSTMSARIVEDASRIVPLPGRDMDAQSIVDDAERAASLRSILEALVRAICSDSGTPDFPGDLPSVP